MTTALYPNNCKQWLKADGALEKWKPKEAGQMSFVVFQLKAQTCMCPQHATFVVLVRFVRHMLTRHCPLIWFPGSVVKARVFFPTPRSAHFVIYVVDKGIFLCLQKRHFWASAPASAPYVIPVS